MGLVPVEALSTPSIDLMYVDWILEAEHKSWMTPIKNYLQRGILPNRKSERRKLLRQVWRYIFQQEALYERGFSVSLLRCVANNEAKQVPTEVHEGACGDHTKGKHWWRKSSLWVLLAAISRDTADYTRKCDKCRGLLRFRKPHQRKLLKWSVNDNLWYEELILSMYCRYQKVVRSIPSLQLITSPNELKQSH